MSAKAPPYIVIGAGIAGLLAAGTISEAGHPVIVLEKSRGVGGRMATRRFQNGIFDHGAQFFTVREPTFEALVADWQERGLILRWANGFAQPNGETKLDGHPRYRGRNGMTAIAKALAQTLEVEVNTHVRAISSNRSGWLIHLQTGETRPARGVIYDGAGSPISSTARGWSDHTANPF